MVREAIEHHKSLVSHRIGVSNPGLMDRNSGWVALIRTFVSSIAGTEGTKSINDLASVSQREPKARAWMPFTDAHPGNVSFVMTS